jgi:tetratricopeptide (TPR) repeat protein
MIKNILLLITFSVSFLTYSQYTEEELNDLLANASEQELLVENTSMAVEGFYYQAGKVAERLLEFDPDNANYNYRMGFALISASNRFEEAIPYLEKAKTNISKKYDMVSVKEKGAPIDVLYFLGKAYHINLSLDEAIASFNEFLQLASTKSQNYKNATLRLKQCNVAQNLLENKQPFEVINMGGVINTEDPEYSPIVSLDGSAIYFTSRRLREDGSNADIIDETVNQYLEDIYVSYKDFEGNWAEPILMEFCLPERNEATVAVSRDERSVFTYIGEGNAGNVYTSSFLGGKYGGLEKIDIPGLNTEYWEPHINVSPDGETIYLVSNRPGGLGGRDIYELIKMPDGSWSEPKNLGPNVNSEYDEDSPFIAIDNKTLYFSSNGPNSMGGFDVFMTKKDEQGVWQDPINVGYPLNTPGDDIYYTTTMDGLTGYITSFREGGFGEKDIYQVKNKHLGIDNIAGLRGEIETVSGARLPEDVGYNIKCLDCDEPSDMKLYPRVADGRFYTRIEPCKTYELRFHYQDGDIDIFTEVFNSSCEEEYTEVYKHYLLDLETMKFILPQEEAESYSPLAFKHYFGYNKNKLDPAKGAFNAFLKAVKEQYDSGRTTVTIRISSSASKVPTKTFGNNNHLAQTRADNMRDVLNTYFSNLGVDVEINIEEVKVDGPSYSRGEAKNIEKFAPFQFVQLNIDGFNNMDEEGLVSLKSKDAELSDKTNLSGDPVSSVMEAPDGTFTTGNAMEGDYQFFIIVGSFRNLDYANGLIENCKSKGYQNTAIVGKRKGLNVVSIGSFDSWSAAKSKLEQVRLDINSSAWILNTSKHGFD